LVDLIAIKENKQENVSNSAITDTNSSIIVEAALFEICIDVITNKQNPKRLAAVGRICCDVLVGMDFKF